jgi:CubicO group peptidase (beta-lactamase class C family)
MKIFTKKRIILSLVIILFVAAIFVGYKNREYVDQLPIGCAFKAKTLCAAVFVSGRDPAVVEREDMGFNPLFKLFHAKINTEEKSITCSLLGTGIYEKKAVHVDKLGAVLLSGIEEKVIREWKPVVSRPEPANPEAVLWPRGEKLPEAPFPANIDIAKINSAVEKLFIEPNPDKQLYTRAVLIVHNGRIIAERYAPGITKDTPLLSWSIAKSFTNAMIGILVRQNKIYIKAPAAVPEWQTAKDLRRFITLDQLLRMSSGLQWVEAYAERPISDVNIMLFLKPDMGAYAAAKPRAVKPDTLWRYSSGTTNIICRLIRKKTGSLEAYWDFPRRELFNKLGMKNAIWETDATGTFIGSSYLYATARDYARFGLLYLNDGVWQGERILPEGWVAYSTTPTPAAPKGEYGAHFWLNRGSDWKAINRLYPQLPADAFFARGYQGQIIAIIPSHKLVAVRLGMTYDDKWGMEPFIKSVIEAIK